MKHAICPNCEADIELPSTFTGGDAWCPNCNQGFFVEPEDPQEQPRTASRMPPPRRGAPRPPVVPPARTEPHILGGTPTIEDSRKRVLTFFIIFAGASLVFFLLYGLLGWSIFAWLGSICAGIFPTGAILWGLIYLRTIAINSERK